MLHNIMNSQKLFLWDKCEMSCFDLFYYFIICYFIICRLHETEIVFNFCLLLSLSFVNQQEFALWISSTHSGTIWCRWNSMWFRSISLLCFPWNASRGKRICLTSLNQNRIILLFLWFKILQEMIYIYFPAWQCS